MLAAFRVVRDTEKDPVVLADRPGQMPHGVAAAQHQVVPTQDEIGLRPGVIGTGSDLCELDRSVVIAIPVLPARKGEKRARDIVALGRLLRSPHP